MPIDRSYLAQHGNRGTYRVQVWVPKHLRPILGSSMLFASCKTDSLSLANLRKHKLIHELKARIKDAEGELRKHARDAPMDPLVTEALEWRAAIRDDDTGAEEGVTPDAEYALSVRLDEVERTQGETRAGCQSARKRTPGSACKRNPLVGDGSRRQRSPRRSWLGLRSRGERGWSWSRLLMFRRGS